MYYAHPQIQSILNVKGEFIGYKNGPDELHPGQRHINTLKSLNKIIFSFKGKY